MQHAHWARGFSTTRALHDAKLPPVSPLAPIGVNAALQATADPSITPRAKLFDEFSLHDRVAIVSGGNSGLGLEMSLALCEAGARAVYCFDWTPEPSAAWKSVRDYAERMNGAALRYVRADVRDQQAMWREAEKIGDQEGRLDVCIAAAGVAKSHKDCLTYPAEEFKEVQDINTSGVLFTAQAAGQQMARFGNGGSIVLIASISGSVTNRGDRVISYNASKSAVLQLARSMACELGSQNIRVNTLSPGYIYTSMTAGYVQGMPEILERWSNLNPMGRIGRPDELRGVIAWLASDASSFCTGSDIEVSGGHLAW